MFYPLSRFGRIADDSRPFSFDSTAVGLEKEEKLPNTFTEYDTFLLSIVLSVKVSSKKEDLLWTLRRFIDNSNY